MSVHVVLHTQSASHAEGARLALVAEGIDAVILDQFSPGSLGIQGSIRVAVAKEADVDRAVALLRSLEPPKSPDLPSWRWHKRGGIAMVVSIAGYWVVLGLDANALPTAKRILAGADLVLLITAVWFFVRGYRADAEHKKRNPPPDDD